MSKAQPQGPEQTARYLPVIHSSENAPLLKRRYGLNHTQRQVALETNPFQRDEIECDTPKRHAGLRFLVGAEVF